MAVIIREKRIIAGKEQPGIKVYKSDGFVTKKMQEDAEKFEVYLKKTTEDIKKQLGQIVFDKTVGATKKTLRIRYELGKMLSFVDDPEIIHPDDKKYVWRALFDHLEDLAPGPPDERAKRRPEMSFFAYCYRLGRLPWDVVDSGGEWSSWQRLFDLAIKNDDRILAWLGQAKEQLQSSIKVGWVKEATKLISEQFHNRETLILSQEELDQELEEILQKARG